MKQLLFSFLGVVKQWLFPASPLEGFNFLPSKGCFQGLFEAENEQVDQPKRPLGREGWSWLIFS